MQFDEIVAVRTTSAAWRLLRADNAPLVLSFLGRLFIDANIREISESELVSLLDDELHTLNAKLGDGTYRQMRQRIATWRGTKGELLDEIVGSRTLISDSDQGRSFQAFYDLLLSPVP